MYIYETVEILIKYYNSYNFRTCDGRVLITECSGLAIISAYPLKEVEFHQYTWKGTIWDGEALAGTYVNFDLYSIY